MYCRVAQLELVICVLHYCFQNENCVTKNLLEIKRTAGRDELIPRTKITVSIISDQKKEQQKDTQCAKDNGYIVDKYAKGTIFKINNGMLYYLHNMHKNNIIIMYYTLQV